MNTKHTGKVRNIVLAALLTAGSAAMASEQAVSEDALRDAIAKFGVDSQVAATAAKEAKAQIEMQRSAKDTATASASKVPAHLLIDLDY